MIVNEKEKYFVTFSSGSYLDIWQDVDNKGYTLVKSSKMHKKLQEALSLSILDSDYLLLLSGGYDSLINVHTVLRANSALLKDGKELLSHKFTLKGHINSIKDISVISAYTNDSYKENNKINKNLMMIATCSQDCYIRLWNVVEIKIDKQDLEKENAIDRSEIFEEYKTKTSYVLKVDNGKFYNILLDSILLGHEESVSSVKWAIDKDGYLVLLSSSFDFTIGIWRYSNNMVTILY